MLDNNIKERLVELGISDIELSVRVGRTSTYLANVIKGVVNPGLELAIKIAYELDDVVENIWTIIK